MKPNTERSRLVTKLNRFFHKRIVWRILFYSILFVACLIGGLVLQFTPLRQPNEPRHLCCYDASGTGSFGPYYDPGGTYEWQINPQSWVADYVKYDLDPQGMNCSYLYLRITNDSSEYFKEVTAFVDHPGSLSVIAQIPLHYNASRNEYVALFNLSPYWGDSGFIQIRLSFHFHEYIGGESWNYFYPYEYNSYHNEYTSIPYGVILPVMGLTCILLIETFIRRLQPVKQKNRKNEELLEIILKQNPAVYEEALSQLGQDRNKLSLTPNETKPKGPKKNQPNFCPYCGAPARFVQGKCGNCGEALDN